MDPDQFDTNPTSTTPLDPQDGPDSLHDSPGTTHHQALFGSSSNQPFGDMVTTSSVSNPFSTNTTNNPSSSSTFSTFPMSSTDVPNPTSAGSSTNDPLVDTTGASSWFPGVPQDSTPSTNMSHQYPHELPPSNSNLHFDNEPIVDPFSTQIPVFEIPDQVMLGQISFMDYMEHLFEKTKIIGAVRLKPPAFWNPLNDPNFHSYPSREAAYRSHYQGLNTLRINHPIRQQVRGANGFYTLTLYEEEDLSLPEFEKNAKMEEEQWQLALQARQRRSQRQNSDESNSDPNHSSGVAGVDQTTPVDPTQFNPALQYEDEYEEYFWTRARFHEPLYGADMSGSLFEQNVSWNLNNLDSLLNILHEDIKGVTSSFLYFGAPKAMFAFHIEDMNLGALNYLHMGAPKKWYVIPPQARHEFENLCKTIVPEGFRKCSEYLRHKTTLVSPLFLRSKGIPVYSTQHCEGEYMVVWPTAYHCGFNLGYNCAEAVNFACESWIPYGMDAKYCLCTRDSVRFDMQRFLNAYADFKNGEVTLEEFKLRRQKSMQQHQEKFEESTKRMAPVSTTRIEEHRPKQLAYNDDGDDVYMPQPEEVVPEKKNRKSPRAEDDFTPSKRRRTTKESSRSTSETDSAQKKKKPQRARPQYECSIAGCNGTGNRSIVSLRLVHDLKQSNSGRVCDHHYHADRRAYLKQSGTKKLADSEGGKPKRKSTTPRSKKQTSRKSHDSSDEDDSSNRSYIQSPRPQAQQQVYISNDDSSSYNEFGGQGQSSYGNASMPTYMPVAVPPPQGGNQFSGQPSSVSSSRNDPHDSNAGNADMQNNPEISRETRHIREDSPSAFSSSRFSGIDPPFATHTDHVDDNDYDMPPNSSPW